MYDANFMVNCKLSKAKCVIAIFFAIVSVFCFIRSWYYEPIDDDLVYQFLLDKPYGTAYYTQHVSNLSDAINSQAQEYFSHSGRFLVHVLVQMFCGVWGRDSYCILNAILLFFTLFMLVEYGVTKKIYTIRTVLLAVLIALGATYWLPFRMSFSIAHSLNYIWPVPLMLIFLKQIRKYNKDSIDRDRMVKSVSLGLLGLITGCTQETYVLPLCVVTFGINT
jgi:hypothetical protein